MTEFIIIGGSLIAGIIWLNASEKQIYHRSKNLRPSWSRSSGIRQVNYERPKHQHRRQRDYHDRHWGDYRENDYHNSSYNRNMEDYYRTRSNTNIFMWFIILLMVFLVAAQITGVINL